MSTFRIIYVSLPPELAEQVQEFPFQSAIPLPVEVPEEQADNWNSAQLTWASLISGMIRVITENPQIADGDYYRALVKTVKPDIVATLLTAAELKTDKGEFSFAEQLFKNLCALEPHESRHQANLALFYQRREDHLLQENEDYSRALAELRRGEAASGETAVRRFLEGNPESANGWFLLGWSQRQQTQWEEALTSFRRSQSLAPAGAELLNEIALCLSELGEADKAVETLRRGLEQDETNTTLLSNLAMVYLRMNDLSRAEDTMNKLREIDPDDPLLAQFGG